MTMPRVIVIGASPVPASYRVGMAALLQSAGEAAVVIVGEAGESCPDSAVAMAPHALVPSMVPIDREARLEPGGRYRSAPGRGLVVGVERVRAIDDSEGTIDTLFGSAALAYGRKVTAILLSPPTEDGSAGLWAVKSRGGTTIVAHDLGTDAGPLPLPRGVEVDFIVPLDELASLLRTLASGGAPGAEHAAAPVVESPPADPRECSDCRAALRQWDRTAGTALECRAGHTHSDLVLLAMLSDRAEGLLAACAEALAKVETLAEELAAREGERGENGEGIESALTRSRAEAQRRLSLVRMALGPA